MRNKKTFAAVTAITVLGFFVRLLFLKKSLVADDWVTLQFANTSWPDFWRYLRLENTPPLFNLLARGWVYFVPITEAWLRLLPIIIGTATIPLFYGLARSSLTRKAALVATALFSVSAPTITESHEFRAYTLATMSSVLFLFLFVRWLHSNQRLTLIFLTLVGILGIYAHLQFGMILLASSMMVLMTRELRRRWRAWFLAMVTIGFTIAPWLWSILTGRTSYVDAPVWWTNLSPGRWTQIGVWLWSLISNASTGSWQTPTVVICLLCMVGWIIAAVMTERRSLLHLPLAQRLLLVVLATGIALGLITNVAAPKYYRVIYPVVPLLLAYCWQIAKPRWLLRVTFIFFFVGLTALTYPTLQNTGGQWNTFSSFIAQNERPGELIIIHPFLDSSIFSYYYRGHGNVEGLLPFRYRSADHFADLLKFNYQQVVRPDTIDDLAGLTSGHTSVLFLTTFTTRGDFFNSGLPGQWFRQHGWEEKKLAVRENGDGFIFRYTRPKPSTVH